MRKVLKERLDKDRMRDKLYAKWKVLVNMSVKELEAFLKSEEGKVAGLSKKEAKDQGIKSGQESAKWIIKMKTVGKDKWTDLMWEWAQRQVNFITRMSAGRGPLLDEEGEKTRRHTSLLVWGHNPTK